MTPTLLCSGAQWFDIQDHDEASTFLPVPMRRRHTLSPRLLPPINEGNFRSGSALVWLAIRGHLTSSAVGLVCHTFGCHTSPQWVCSTKSYDWSYKPSHIVN